MIKINCSSTDDLRGSVRHIRPIDSSINNSLCQLRKHLNASINHTQRRKLKANKSHKSRAQKCSKDLFALPRYLLSLTTSHHCYPHHHHLSRCHQHHLIVVISLPSPPSYYNHHSLLPSPQYYNHLYFCYPRFFAPLLDTGWQH